MTLGARVLLGFFVLVVLVFAWMMRLDAKAGSSGAVIVTDRWTGKVYNCFGGCRIVYPEEKSN